MPAGGAKLVGAGAPIVTGKRIFVDGMSGLGHKQSLWSWLVALVTLSVYVGFMNFLFILLALSFWYKWALYLLLALFSTVLLPAKPVLWPAFNR